MINNIKCFLGRHTYKVHTDKGIYKKYMYKVCTNCHKIDTKNGNFLELLKDINNLHKKMYNQEDVFKLWFK